MEEKEWRCAVCKSPKLEIVDRKNLTQVAQDIQDYRGKHGLTLQEMADRVGCSIRTVQRWEKEGRIPRGLYMARLRNLGVTGWQRRSS